MPSKKAGKPDLNAPLRSLSDRLRVLQKEATQLLDNVRIDRLRSEPARETQMVRITANFLERWDIATRGDLEDIHRRLEAIEAAILSLRAPDGKEKAPKPSSKTRRRKRPPTD